MPPIDEMIKRLEQKLKDDPGSAQGWLMLGRSYVYTNRYPDAVRAYAQAEALTDPPDAQLYAEYAEAMALANGDRLAGAPERLVEKSLKLQPDNPNALWLAGMIAFQKADYLGAVKYWEPLQKVTNLDSEQGRILADFLAQARAGKPLDKIIPAATEAAAQESAPVPAPPAAGGGATLKVHVALDPALAPKAAPDDIVFIFARAVQGSPMPLAIVRKQVKDLPVDVVLDDSLAMMPAMKLSAFPEVVVGARISKSGNAMPASGDLQSLSDALQTSNAQPVNITINQVVP
jgi:cytochrome c-type biogenesis protein CcmH